MASYRQGYGSEPMTPEEIQQAVAARKIGAKPAYGKIPNTSADSLSEFEALRKAIARGADTGTGERPGLPPGQGGFSQATQDWWDSLVPADAFNPRTGLVRSEAGRFDQPEGWRNPALEAPVRSGGSSAMLEAMARPLSMRQAEQQVFQLLPPAYGREQELEQAPLITAQRQRAAALHQSSQQRALDAQREMREAEHGRTALDTDRLYKQGLLDKEKAELALKTDPEQFRRALLLKALDSVKEFDQLDPAKLRQILDSLAGRAGEPGPGQPPTSTNPAVPGAPGGPRFDPLASPTPPSFEQSSTGQLIAKPGEYLQQLLDRLKSAPQRHRQEEWEKHQRRLRLQEAGLNQFSTNPE